MSDNTLEKLLDQREQLLAKIEQLDRVLGNRRLTDNNGKRMPAREYVRWRDNTIGERNELLKQYRQVKRLISKLSPK